MGNLVGDFFYFCVVYGFCDLLLWWWIENVGLVDFFYFVGDFKWWEFWELICDVYYYCVVMWVYYFIRLVVCCCLGIVDGVGVWFFFGCNGICCCFICGIIDLGYCGGFYYVVFGYCLWNVDWFSFVICFCLFGVWFGDYE